MTISTRPNLNVEFGNRPARHGALVQEIHQAFLEFGVFESSHIALHKLTVDVFEETVSGMVPKILFHGNGISDSAHRIILTQPGSPVTARTVR